jgi:hypothetical protein
MPDPRYRSWTVPNCDFDIACQSSLPGTSIGAIGFLDNIGARIRFFSENALTC